jgi:phage-related protein
MYLRKVIPGTYIWAVAEGADRCSVLHFLNNLSPTAHVFIHRNLQYLASGQHLPSEVAKKLADRIWELRKGNARVLYFTDGPQVIILTNAFIKKSSQTPRTEKERAIRQLKRYLLEKARGRLLTL